MLLYKYRGISQYLPYRGLKDEEKRCKDYSLYYLNRNFTWYHVWLRLSCKVDFHVRWRSLITPNVLRNETK